MLGMATTGMSYYPVRNSLYTDLSCVHPCDKQGTVRDGAAHATACTAGVTG